LAGLTLNDGVFSSWNGHSPFRRPPPALFSCTPASTITCSIEAHKQAAAFYTEQLGSPEAKTGREFLAVRGFDQAAAQQYGVGYAPQGWDSLVKHLRAKGFSDAELVAGGLAGQSSRGTLIDKFRGRLLWPIRDIGGEVIGFGARKLYDDDQGPKYLNTSETPIYKKSSVLYGIDLAKKEIARRRQAVVVEGYTDVMACHLAGVPTAIATCGTAFGADHISVIRRLLMDQDEFRGEVIFTFDGDAAGQKAALKAFGDDQRFVTQTFIAAACPALSPSKVKTTLAGAWSASSRMIRRNSLMWSTPNDVPQVATAPSMPARWHAITSV
jgi:DNA primase